MDSFCATMPRQRAWADALILMRRALALLDQSHCAPDIGAHLDLAATRLELSILEHRLRRSEEPTLLVETV